MLVLGTWHSVRNMALGKFCILFTFNKVKWCCTGRKYIITMTPIDIRPSPCVTHRRHASACKISPQYVAPFLEEIANRCVSQLWIIIWIDFNTCHSTLSGNLAGSLIAQDKILQTCKSQREHAYWCTFVTVLHFACCELCNAFYSCTVDLVRWLCILC